MHALDRRVFLRISLAGAAVYGSPRGVFAARAPANPSRKLLTLFLRGGNDALNTLIPTHDGDYYAASTRPTLAVPYSASLDLGNGGAAFHPALAKLKELHDAGFLASIQRVGYPQSTLSHFAGQQFIETALPGDVEFLDGWVARWAAVRAGASTLPAVSVSPQLMRMFSGDHVLAHVPDLAKYSLSPGAASAKLLGGAQDLYSAPANGAAYDELVKETGGVLGETLALLASLPSWNPPASSFPTTPSALAQAGLPVELWAAQFFRELRDALHILKFSECQIAGLEIPGFDTHSQQGLLTGPHAERLAVLAHGLRSVWIETSSDLWSDLVCLVQSEFGRASRENGSLGTDHGESGATFVAGGPVLGAVHHCDPVSWPTGDTLFSSKSQFVEHRTDYRAVLAEILERHLALTGSEIDIVIPGHSGFSGTAFQPLGLLV